MGILRSHDLLLCLKFVYTDPCQIKEELVFQVNIYFFLICHISLYILQCQKRPFCRFYRSTPSHPSVSTVQMTSIFQTSYEHSSPMTGATIQTECPFIALFRINVTLPLCMGKSRVNARIGTREKPEVEHASPLFFVTVRLISLLTVMV